eukprot:CFRG7131T1
MIKAGESGISSQSGIGPPSNGQHPFPGPGNGGKPGRPPSNGQGNQGPPPNKFKNACSSFPCSAEHECTIPNAKSPEEFICTCNPPKTGDLCTFTYSILVSDKFESFNATKFVAEVAEILDVPAQDVGFTSFDSLSREVVMRISSSASEILTYKVQQGEPAITQSGVVGIKKDSQVISNPAVENLCSIVPCANNATCLNVQVEDVQIEDVEYFFNCTCPTGWHLDKSDKCDSPVSNNPCEDKPCGANGACVVVNFPVASIPDEDENEEHGALYRCDCTSPWTGDVCSFTYSMVVIGDVSEFSADEFSVNLTSILSLNEENERKVLVVSYTSGSVQAALSLSTESAISMTKMVSEGNKDMVELGVQSVTQNDVTWTNPNLNDSSEDDGGSSIVIIIAIVAVVLGVIVCAICVVWYWKRRSKNTKMTMRATNVSLANTATGFNGSRGSVHAVASIDSEYATTKKRDSISSSTCLYGTMEDRPLPILPSDISQQINSPEAIALRETVQSRHGPIENASLVRMGVMGSGAFGMVYRGVLSDGQLHSPVAIKELKTTDENEVALFFAEAELIRSLKHDNIVNCIGIAPGPPLTIVLELMTMGDLRTYLRSQKRRESLVTITQRYWIIFQVSRGLQYLARHGVVHRDLAARNCMVSNPTKGTHGFPVVKVSDFGLSRSFNEGENYYRMESNGKVPVPWMPPEAIENKRFSQSSDVWSFGVTMWEVFSNAASCPYPGQSLFSLLSFLKRGQRLSKPVNCPQEAYDMMLGCWADEPNARPSFQMLTINIAHLFVPHSAVPVSVEVIEEDVFILDSRFVSDGDLQIQDVYVDIDGAKGVLAQTERKTKANPTSQDVLCTSLNDSNPITSFNSKRNGSFVANTTGNKISFTDHASNLCSEGIGSSDMRRISYDDACRLDVLPMSQQPGRKRGLSMDALGHSKLNCKSKVAGVLESELGDVHVNMAMVLNEDQNRSMEIDKGAGRRTNASASEWTRGVWISDMPIGRNKIRSNSDIALYSTLLAPSKPTAAARSRPRSNSVNFRKNLQSQSAELWICSEESPYYNHDVVQKDLSNYMIDDVYENYVSVEVIPAPEKS